MGIGDRLKKIRDRKGLNQKEAAELMGISNVVLNRYENDERTPDLETLGKLAEFYCVTTDYLLGRTNNNDTTPSWATSKDKRDFKKMLEEDGALMFDGVPIEGDDRQRIKDVLTGLFWEAKQMNKHKKKSDSTNDTKK